MFYYLILRDYELLFIVPEDPIPENPIKNDMFVNIDFEYCKHFFPHLE